MLNREVQSQNNVEYDKPLKSISLVGEGEGDGGWASKTRISVSVDRCSSVNHLYRPFFRESLRDFIFSCPNDDSRYL